MICVRYEMTHGFVATLMKFTPVMCWTNEAVDECMHPKSSEGRYFLGRRSNMVWTSRLFAVLTRNR